MRLLFLLFLGCAALGRTAEPVVISARGDGPNLAVDREGRWHVIYLLAGTYRYVIHDPRDGSRTPERDTTVGVERGSLDRGYGHIVVDHRATAHVFTGMGYAQFASGASQPVVTRFERRDPALALDEAGRVLLVMRGHDRKKQDYTGDGTILGALVKPGASTPGELFKIDAGLNGRNGHVYPGAAAGPGNTFHVVYRHGPEARVWYLQSRDATSWSGGAVPIHDEEGPRIAVSSDGRVLIAAATGEMVERVHEAWQDRGRPVGGAKRSPPSLAADRAGNLFATHGGRVAVLRRGATAWTEPVVVPHFARRRTHDQSAHLADGLAEGTVLVYESADAILALRIGADGTLR